MKVAAVTGPGKAEVVEVPDPTVADNYCLVKITAAPMCTEFHGLAKGNPTHSMGHEAAGVIVDVGPRAGLAKGDRVVVMPQNPCGRCHLCLAGEHIHCQHPRKWKDICGCDDGRATFAQYCIQQDWLCWPIPDDISDEHASLACCGLGPTFNACRLMGVSGDDTVIVSGLGPVGLGGVINATHLGARVIGLDLSPYRLALARDLGAAEVIDPTAEGALDRILELTGGIGADKVIETANTAESVKFGAEAVRRKGQLAFVSWAGELPVRTIVAKGLRIHGAWHWNHQTHGRAMLGVLGANAAKFDRMITHRFGLTRIADAFACQESGQCGKVILDPWK